MPTPLENNSLDQSNYPPEIRQTKLLLQATGTGFWTWDTSCDHFTCSEELVNILGYSGDLPIQNYDTFLQLFTDENADKLNEAVQKTMLTGKPFFSLRLGYSHPGHFKKWLLASTAAISCKDGRVITLFGTIQDLTQIQIEEYLEQTSALAHTAELLYNQTDLDLVLKTVCEETSRLFNTPYACVLLREEKDQQLRLRTFTGLPDSLKDMDIKVPLTFFKNSFTPTEPQTIITDILQEPQVPYYALLLELDIRTLIITGLKWEDYLIGTLMLMSRGEIKNFNSTETDLLVGIAKQTAQAIFDSRLFRSLQFEIDKLNKTELALQKSSARFQALFSGMYEGVCFQQFVYNEMKEAVDYLILDVNPQYESMIGLKKEEIVNKMASEIFRTSTPPFLNEFKTAVKDRKPYYFEFYNPQLDRFFYISVLRIEQDVFAAVFFDITDRRRAEKEISILNANLEKRVAERTAELADANKELESFSYSISHDLQSPLVNIKGWSEALIEEYEPVLDKTARGYVDTIRTEAQRMSALIEALLGLSNLIRRELIREKIDISDLARDVAAEIRRQEPGREAEFIITQGLKSVGDPVLIRNLLYNLINNAWKFTSKNEKTKIFFGETFQDGKQVYYVRDNGAGFDRNKASKLFIPFKRLHSQKDFPGNGIGLATVKRIVRRHKGDIWAESEIGKGATFYFTLGNSEDMDYTAHI